MRSVKSFKPKQNRTELQRASTEKSVDRYGIVENGGSNPTFDLLDSRIFRKTRAVLSDERLCEVLKLFQFFPQTHIDHKNAEKRKYSLAIFWHKAAKVDLSLLNKLVSVVP
jgi:hypothetical protein